AGRRGERAGQPAVGVTARALGRVERDVAARGARDPVGAVDELLAVVGPAAVVVGIAEHDVDPAIGVAAQLEGGGAAGGAGADHAGEGGFVEAAHRDPPYSALRVR